MNPKLKIALIRRYSNQGFALPLAVGMGFVMLLIATTLMMRSQGDETTAKVQKNTAQSLTVAEGGIARSLFNLQQQNNGAYLALSYDPINTAVSPQKTFLGPNGILDDGDGETTEVNQWSDPPNRPPCTPSTGSIPIPTGLESGTIGTGSSVNYTVKAYRYRDPDGAPRSGDETGTLLINGDQSSAKSQVQVTIPIVQSALSGSFPGLYASNSINLGNNDILRVAGQNGSSANIICKDCVVPPAQCSGNKPTQAGLEAAVGKNNNGVIDGSIYIGNPQLPPLPTAPATACSGTSGPNCSINLGSFNVSTMANLPRPSDVTNRAAWAISNPTAWGTAVNEPYHYVITDMGIGNNVVTVDTSTAPVYLYVSGNVTMNGGGGIAHTGRPADLRLYGKPADANNSNDQTITISGGSQASRIFIYAPDATVGINGGSNDPDILGAVWAKTWNASGSNNADIKVPDDMPMQLGGSFSGAGMQAFSSGSPSTWQRQPVSQ